MRAMEKLVEQGKIRHIGVSNFLQSETETAMKSLQSNKLSTIQTEYNLFERSVEDSVIPFCDENNILLVAYSPLAQGNLANGFEQREILSKISKKYQKNSGQIVLNWLCYKEQIVVIPNTSKKHRALENAKSLDFRLSDDDYNLISDKLKTPVSHTN